MCGTIFHLKNFFGGGGRTYIGVHYLQCKHRVSKNKECCTRTSKIKICMWLTRTTHHKEALTVLVNEIATNIANYVNHSHCTNEISFIQNSATIIFYLLTSFNHYCIIYYSLTGNNGLNFMYSFPLCYCKNYLMTVKLVETYSRRG